MSRANPKVLVAMSGGVDSSVAAALMVKRGYHVIGVTLQIWQESQNDPRHAGCCSLGAVEDARRVARELGISHYVLNFKEEFRKSVIDNFVDEYSRGRTPNPCVQCNRYIKFDLLLDKMHELGCSELVTGHYARIRHDKNQNRYRLLKARGREKDQSYVLYMLAQEQMKYCRFPLGEFASKAEVRQLAKQFNLHLSEKPDSQEICFVSEAGGYREFLRKSRPESFAPGVVVDTAGNEIGSHDGVADFTIGQRKGIGVSNAKPLYVIQVDAAQNRVMVGSNDALKQSEVILEEPVWGTVNQGANPTRVTAKIRHNMDAQPATLFPEARPRLVFDQPVRAVTPGQIAVAYTGKSVAAGGTIIGSPVFQN